MSDPVVIVGGGLAGLVCAKELSTQGIDYVLLEASDKPGGRVRTDECNGFLLDRGFQVLLTAYPEAKRHLDYEALQLKAFEPGSLIQLAESRHRMSDPWRRPLRAISTAFAPVGSIVDKLRIATLRAASGKGSLADVFCRDDRSTLDELRRLGFSDTIIERFFRPFLGGVFLDSSLETSSRMLYFVFRMFSQGDIALPAAGMGDIATQLASQIPDGSIRTGTAVEAIESNSVRLGGGKTVAYADLVIATDQVAAGRLLPELESKRTPRSVYCVYFDAPEAPLTDRMLLLNGSGQGIVNNLCVPNLIAPGYAPAGRSLISATVLDTDLPQEDLHLLVQSELKRWFGRCTEEWKHIRTYRIPNALPNHTTPAFQPAVLPAALREHVYVCGDYRANGSINGAMHSGRLVAESILSSR